MINDKLYALLQRRYGEVVLYKENERNDLVYHNDIESGDLRLDMERSTIGEQYRVNCPYCKSDGHKLYINYEFGQISSKTGKPLLLAKCFRQPCRFYEDIFYFYRMLTEMAVGGIIGDIAPEQDVPDEPVEQDYSLPRSLVDLKTLPKTSVVYRHLVFSRKLSISALNDFYGLRYCMHDHRYYARNRLIYPVVFNGETVGWQSRAPTVKDESGRKYHTQVHKVKQILGNLDNAKERNFVVVVEGIFDMFKVGPCAVCTFGAAISSAQALLLKKTEKPVILLLDPSVFSPTDPAHAVAMKSLANLRFAVGERLLPVQLPCSKDPGSLCRKYLKRVIRSTAVKADFPIKYADSDWSESGKTVLSAD